jgi:hypothetical protein
MARNQRTTKQVSIFFEALRTKAERNGATRYNVMSIYMNQKCPLIPPEANAPAELKSVIGVPSLKSRPASQRHKMKMRLHPKKGSRIFP